VNLLPFYILSLSNALFQHDSRYNLPIYSIVKIPYIFFMWKIVRAFSIVPKPASITGGGLKPTLFTENIREFKDVKLQSGRAWRPDELRLKSNEDLHKLWYVCLRELNVIESDNQFKVQHSSSKGPQDRKKKMKQSMARILTIIRERELIRESYWKKLEEEYLEINVPKPEPVKKERNLTEEQKLKTEKRKLAISRIPDWKYLNNARRREAIKAEYGKMAKEAKETFLKELRYVGAVMKEKGITPETNTSS
jgi:hypothetical protein